MFERFTDLARQVVVQAQEEARFFNHNYIGSEHLLLGLLRVESGEAFKALEALGVTSERAREVAEEILGQGKPDAQTHMPFTPRAKKVLEWSLRVALRLDHSYIGSEHILLALLENGGGGVAMQIFARLETDTELLHEDMMARLGFIPAIPTTVLVLDLANFGLGKRYEKLRLLMTELGTDHPECELELARCLEAVSRRLRKELAVQD